MFRWTRAAGIAAAFVASFWASPSVAAEAQTLTESTWSLPAVATPQAAPAATPTVTPAPQPVIEPAPAPLYSRSSSAVAAAGAARDPYAWRHAFSPVPALPAPPAVKASLRELVETYVDYGGYDRDLECLANAVYFEARSESLEGQLAVAEVVLNRAASGRYPPSICAVVVQPAQFSFIQRGQFPRADRGSRAWHKAVAIAEIARKNMVDQVPPNVLWYHADYVSPSWGRRLTRVTQIGTHIFYS